MAVDELFGEHLEYLDHGLGRALEQCVWDAVVLYSGALLPRSPFDDQHFAFRAMPAFAHWCPLARPDCYLIVRPGARPVLYRPVVEDFWHGEPPFDAGAALEHFEVIDYRGEFSLDDSLRLGTRIAWITEHPEAVSGAKTHAINPAELLTAFDTLRLHKTAYEVACIDEANRIAAQGHRSVADVFLAGGTNELALHLRYLAATGQVDGTTPYQGIVAIGGHAGILHHNFYSSVESSGSLLVDAGAQYRGYASDITRTWVDDSQPGHEDFRALVEHVERWQAQLCRDVAVGMNYEELHERSHFGLAEILCELGIVLGSAEAACNSGVTRAFFPHGLGHSLGLQVHDVGGKPRAPAPHNGFLRSTFTLAAGQVFTIEPGCYFIPQLLAELRASDAASSLQWDLVERLLPFGGVRVEDNIYLMPQGSKNLTRTYLP